MKICFPFVGDSVGGSHISSIILIKELLAFGIDVVIVIHRNGLLATELRAQGIDYEILNLPMLMSTLPRKFGELIKTICSVLILYRFIRSRKIDIIHSNDARTHLTWWIPTSVCRIYHVWHQRTALAESWLFRKAIHSSSVVVAISDFVKKSLPVELHSRTVVVSNPVSTKLRNFGNSHDCRKQIKNYAGLSEKAIIVGAVGNLRRIKDPISIVETFIKLDRLSETPCILSIFGEDRENFGPRMRVIAERAELSERFLLMGFKRPIEPWIKACDLILATSLADGFGRSIIEAMSLGVPVVATNAGGHSEIVDHMVDGILIKPGDSSEMALGAHTILASPSLKNCLIDNGKSKVLLKYSANSHAEKMIEIYRNLSRD